MAQRFNPQESIGRFKALKNAMRDPHFGHFASTMRFAFFWSSSTTSDQQDQSYPHDCPKSSIYQVLEQQLTCVKVNSNRHRRRHAYRLASELREIGFVKMPFVEN
jgi:hypothetical protein